MGRSSAEGDDYAPFDDDYRGFDGRDEEAARGPLILALAVGVLLIFGAVVWNTYRQGVRPEGEGLPSVIVTDEPIRTAPEDAGGVVVPNTDKRFYDELDATSREPVTEAALPEDELAGEGVVNEGVPANLRRGPVEPITELGAAPVLPPPIETETVTASAVEAAPVVPAVSEPVPEPQGPRVRFAFAANGPYLVQIAALRSEEAAETSWKRVTASAPELYYGATKVIQRADLGSEGVFYRLRVGAFADRSEASAFCEAIKEAGANCIVVNG